ncbi:MAG: GDSL-type esterase/lipase family protein [Alphaproteobacteria bacterium]|nr:GDSL-type esterase/lipase family protein [Alphaproteobacteria bacterium]
MTFGGSTSVNEWTYAEHGVHYSSILGDLLRSHVPGKKFEVINVANEAYATPHSIIQLALNVLAWNPDIVILSHNFNDLTATYFEDFRPNYSHKFSHEYYSMRWGKYTCRSLRICRFVTSRLEQIGFFGYPVERRSYGSLPPVAGQQTFERNLRSFVALAAANGIKTVLGSQPMEMIQADEFDRDMATKPYNRVVKYPLHGEFVDHHRHYNHIIEMVAKETGVIFVDQSAIFDGKPNYFEDFIHYSKLGVEQLARNYADAILPVLTQAESEMPVRPDRLSNLEP